MAPADLKSKKRKVATDAAPKPKKQKQDAVKTSEASSKPVDEAPVKTRASRKRAEDMWEENVPAEAEAAPEKKSKKKTKAPAAVEDEPAPTSEKPKKATKAKKTAADSAPVDEAPEEKAAKPKKTKAKEAVTEAAPAAEEPKSAKKAKKAQKAAKEPTPEPEVQDQPEESDEDEDDDEDDQTAALLAGFESDRDESDAEKEDEGLDPENFKDKVPKGIMKKLKNVSQKEEKPGVVFVGRIPHGFYESQMKAYFSQFGKVTRLRVSRNKKTGAPKHYAFVEFASADVAEIVAKTMDKYLMFNHILQCSVIPPEQVHPNLFLGANQRYKRIPRNKMVGTEMARGVERAVWEKRVANENKRRDMKNKALKEKLGYEYEAPTVKAVEAVPKAGSVLENGTASNQLPSPSEAQEQTDVPEPEVAEEVEEAPKAAKKSKKAKEAPEVAEPKTKKRKSLTSEEVPEKTKKTRKSKK
ncbi:RNA-binding domain-containing protein [Sporormia fimetaria CBS 119925]|uniref:RNA-binding domain-containing protein n=1 Tax=Sporormia fimetaria CBS 119925 TaxID=1340428 RepID=A0A6A6UZ72_9PLEO|nr:RNA-binding domain-containing protein [Sporormia fimetaria CBS 119925]